MKKIRYIILLCVAGSFFLQGCSDSFLDESAKDKNFADNTFTDLNGFKTAKYAMLNTVRDERREPIQSAELGVIWKIGTDVAWANTELSWTRGLNQYTKADLTPTMQFLNGDVTDPSGRPGIFLILYRCINTANMVINRAENSNVDWLGKNEEENLANKNEMIAHARLMRAWCYRHLAMTFGPVPINDVEITGENFRDDWRRDPVEKVQELIEEDLIFAEKYLPDYSTDVTVLTKPVAQHYLADLYLWQGRNKEAAEAAKRAVSNPNYKLITKRYGVNKDQPGCPFMDQFYDGNILPSEGNTEALWVLPNTPVDNVNGRYNNSMRRTWVSAYNNLGVAYTPEYGGRGLGRASITAWVFSIYEPQDDRFSEYAVRKKYVDKNGRDIICDMDASAMTTNNHKWASTRKWDWTFDDPNRWGESYAYGDQTYLRIADTYLLLAEALYKTGNSSTTDGAAYYINLVRTRSNATPITDSQVTLDFILDERARELVTEEERRETLVRTGTLIERTRKYNPIAAGTRNGVPGIQDYHVLLPFPQTIIDTNTGFKLDQNEGY
ncbi:MAG: RagB/SusD family nutrient uptake outer membrane protein [Dysgonomonas sp.]